MPAGNADRKLRRRYCELRFNEEKREVTGTLLRYGDVAELPWGKERIEAGAFGDIGDAILNVMHRRDRPVARTRSEEGAGRLELIDSQEKLELKAVLSDTTDSRDAIQLIKDRVLRGLSIEFWAEGWRYEKEADGGRIEVVTEAELFGAGIVDSPAYPQSTLDVRGDWMNPKPPNTPCLLYTSPSPRDS